MTLFLLGKEAIADGNLRSDIVADLAAIFCPASGPASIKMMLYPSVLMFRTLFFRIK
jgi:hypothetical protein